MKRITLFAALALIVGPAVAAEPDAGIAVIQDLGRVNGQALACSQMATSGQAKKLMIKHSPKTRRYGEVFEEATNAAYLEQGKDQDSCPKLTDFSARITEISGRLQATLPAAQ
jgi:hypothetical protein